MRRKSLMMVIVALIGIALIMPTAQARAHGGGWVWGPAAFAGGLLLGTSLARPYYYAPPPVYVYPTPTVVYAPQPTYYAPSRAYAYPDPSLTAPQSRGQWVEVPGQSVNGVWVPAHKAWAPY
jgi:hypothetical protein